MKKIAVIAFLLTVCVAAGRAQESRQDISLSGTGLIEPFIGSPTDVQVHSNPAFGALAQLPLHAYALQRPRGQLRHHLPEHDHLHDQPQRLQRSDPHPGDFRPPTSAASTSASTIPLSRPVRAHSSSCPSATPAPPRWTSSSRPQIGAIYGAGIAHEISPSFDIRAEFRGIVTKVPTFGITANSTPTSGTTSTTR